MERTRSTRPFLLLFVSLIFAGCGAAPPAEPPAPATVSAAEPAPKSEGTPLSAETPTPPETGRTADAVTPVSHPAEHQSAPRASQTRATAPESTPAPTAVPVAAPKEGTPTPSPTAKPSATAAPTASAAKESGVVDPGGVVEVKATKSGLTRIGSDKCKLCHKVQFTSWAGTAHATRTPPLDCESCHGAGSEYKSMAIMKDGGKARAAGLVTPDKTFCMKCHKSGWKDDMLKRAHAHKNGA